MGKKGGNKPPATQSTISLNKLLSEFVTFLELASVLFGLLLLKILTRNRKLLIGINSKVESGVTGTMPVIERLRQEDD